MNNDAWTLKIINNRTDELSGIFTFRGKNTLKEWMYAHVSVAQTTWDEKHHVCKVFLDVGRIH